MTDEQMREFSINEIVQDLKAILDCLQICMYNKTEAAIFQGINPYLCVFVYSAYEYLEDQKIILGISDNDFKKKIGKSRSKFLKQYLEFNKGTYKSLNEFNRKEYIKFYHKIYPNLHPVIVKEITNYYIASINNKPVDNYHLSSGIFGCEIGSYIDDITPAVEMYIYQMVSFVGQILSAADIKMESVSQSVLFDEVKYADINMVYSYQNFGIRDNPPILMAFLDILCTLNSYSEVFTKISPNQRLNLKVKYLVLFQSICGLKKVIEFCQESKISLSIKKEFIDFIWQTNNLYCKGKLRRYCAHYGYIEKYWEKDPVKEVFEEFFKKSISEIIIDLDEKLLQLSIYLNEFVIQIPFADKN